MVDAERGGTILRRVCGYRCGADPAGRLVAVKPHHYGSLVVSDSAAREILYDQLSSLFYRIPVETEARQMRRDGILNERMQPMARVRLRFRGLAKKRQL